jgi:putative SOS response-associated peptidase YedK
MCGRYVVVSKITEIEERFQVKMPFDLPPNYNLGPGSMAPVITSEKPFEVQLFKFGFTPFWARKQMYLFNARAEGDHNPDNDPKYAGAMGIISKPAFRKAIRSNRCLIIADAFIEGTIADKLDSPFLVHLGANDRPFAFAGIWDEWVDKSTGEVIRSFAIITTTPNDLLMKLPHHRSPVILSRKDESHWLNPDLPLAEVTAMLQPYRGSLMNAYPIARDIKNPRANTPELLQPVGPPVNSDKSLILEQELVLQGMGFTRARERKND